MGSAPPPFRLVLVDTSVWIGHLRKGDDHLFSLLESQQVLTHPFIIGEILLGSVHDRAAQRGMLEDLPTVIPTRHSEVMRLIDARRLYSTGLSYVDAHILAAAVAMDEVAIWTNDKGLHEQATRLGVAYG